MVSPALFETSLPLYLAAGVVSLISSIWAVRLPRLALWFLVLSLVAGQVIRLPLPGQGGGLLLSDLAVVLVLLSAGLQWVLKRSRLTASSYLARRRGPAQGGGKLTAIVIIPFILWSLFTLVVNSPQYTFEQLAVAAAYWVRLASYLLAIPALVFLVRHKQLHRSADRALLVAISVVAILGIVQVFVIPDLRLLNQGWDPHQGRLVSTWLDPNFVGLFFVIGISYIGARIVQTIHQHTTLNVSSVILTSILVLTSIALVVTQSRSALLAGAVAVLATVVVITARLVHHPHRATITALSASGTILLVIATIGVLLLGERAIGTVTYDPTVVLRLEALQEVWQLAQQHSLVGVGYNAYQYAAQEVGLISDFTIHSRAGADTSYLTLWVTTGLVGVLLFGQIWLTLLYQALRRWMAVGDPIGISVISSIVAVATHAVVVNSFLYAHILIVLALLISLLQSPPRQSRA